MTSSQGGSMGRRGEPVRSRLADRLEHLETRGAVVVGHEDEALVDQVRHLVQDIAVWVAVWVEQPRARPLDSRRRTRRGRRTTIAAGSSRSRLQATVSWRVRCRAGMSTLAVPGRASRFARRSRTPATPSRGTRAAASSIPSGRPSSRRQMSTAGSAFWADKRERGLGSPDAIHEQPDRRNASDLIEDRRVARLRYGQRAEGEDLLGRQPQRCSAGRDHLDRRRGGEDLADDARAGEDLFEVVEHEEQRPIGEIVEESLSRRSAGDVAQAERGDDRRSDEVRVGDRIERDEPDAIGKGGSRAPGKLDRQARLAGPAGSQEGDEAVVRQQPLELDELALAPDEARHPRREVGRLDVDGPDRWERPRADRRSSADSSRSGSTSPRRRCRRGRGGRRRRGARDASAPWSPPTAGPGRRAPPRPPGRPG